MKILFWLIPLFFLNPVCLIAYSKTKKKSILAIETFLFIIGVLYAFFLNYTVLLDKTLPAFFKAVIPVFVICYIISIMALEREEISGIFTGIVVLLALVWLYMLIVYPFTIKKDLAKLTKVNVEEGKLEDTNIEHIPIIPYSNAKYKGDKVLGRIENYSLYTIGDYHIQKVGNELFWVAPIEFNGYFSYKKAKEVNYYIKVSAELDKPAELVKIQAKYTPTAWFGNNLERMVRNKYPNIVIMDASFEPDDTGKAYYAVSYGHYSNYRSGRVVDGVILFDPSNGDMKKYSKEETPAFVDQVIPDDVALDYNTWYGKYQLGLFNYLFSKQGVHVPTEWGEGKEVAGVFTEKGDFYYATDHTNLDSKSTTMVGYAMINGRTGTFDYYPSVKGSNGKAALLVVEKTFQKEQWKGEQPLLYSIYGANTWIIPVVDSNGVFREIALVNAETSKICHAPTKQEAFEKYRVLLATSDQGNANPTKNNMAKTIEGKVVRVINLQTAEGGVQRILLEASDSIFSINTDTMPYAVFTKEGDTVEMKYLDTNDKVNVVREFKNKSLNIK